MFLSSCSSSLTDFCHGWGVSPRINAGWMGAGETKDSSFSACIRGRCSWFHPGKWGNCLSKCCLYTVTHSTVHSWHSSTPETTSEMFCNYNCVKMRNIKSLFNSRMALTSRMRCLAEYQTFVIVSIYWLMGTGNGTCCWSCVLSNICAGWNLVTNTF